MKPEVKITLIEQAFQSVYTRKKLKRVSLRQFVNRLLLFTHKPRIFLFYKKVEDKGETKWKFSFSTHGDYLYIKKYVEQVEEGLNKEDYYCPEYFLDRKENGVTIKWPDNPEQIGATGFGIIIVAVDAYFEEVKNKKKDKKRIVDFISPIKICGDNNINTEYPLIKELWERFLNTDYSKTLGVEKRIKMRLEEIHKNPDKERNLINKHPPKETLNEKDLAFINDQLENLEQILNLVYHDVCETPLVCNKGKIPPNLFFFVRYYEEETCERFKDGIKGEINDPYPYSLKICLPEEQKKHIKKALEIIAEKSEPEWDDESGKGSWKYNYSKDLLAAYDEIFKKDDSIKSEENSCYPDKKLDDAFWDQLRKGEFDEITRDLQKPFGENARSFVDPAMVTGYIHYRSGVFSENGQERVKYKEWKQKYESLDVRRMVYFHYLLSAAAPESNYENLGTMTVPLNVAGQPFISLVQAIVTKDETDLDYTDKVSWPRNFHFFTDIARHCVRKIRYHSKRYYLEQIEKIVSDVFDESIRIDEVGDRRGVYIDLEYVQDRINKSMRLLCRVWPYPIVSIEIVKNIPKNMDNTYFVNLFNAIGGNTGVVFTRKKNPFFVGEDDVNSDTNPLDLNSSGQSGNVYLSKKEIKESLDLALQDLDEKINKKLNVFDIKNVYKPH